MIPAEAWGPIGIAAGALIAGLVNWWLGRKKPQVDAGTLALNLAASLREDVTRLSARVESLELDRNAYRSWSHVLWAHIHDEQTPRMPAPSWPNDLAR